MEIKKTYTYSCYKQVQLTINFKDEAEYKALLRAIDFGEKSADTFLELIKEQLEAPCS